MSKLTFEIRSVFLTMALVLLGSLGVVFWSTEYRQALGADVLAQEKIVNRLERLLSAMKDAETGQRGFLLTGTVAYLEPYESSLAAVSSELTRVRKLADDGALAKAEVEILMQRVGAMMEELRQTAALRRQAGLEPALARLNQGIGKAAFDDVRASVARLEGPERRELAAATDAAQWAGRIRDATFLATLFANLGFLFWAYRKIVRGIALREDALEQVRRQHEILATTLASIGDGVIITDNNARITYLNPVAEGLTGWPAGEAVGMPCSGVFRIIGEISRAVVESPVDKVLEMGHIAGLANHTVLIRKDGSEMPIDDSAAPIRGAGGTTLGVVLVFHDFSAHKQAARILSDARDEVERASKAKDLFLAALSHELRTPLAPVLAILSEWGAQADFPVPLKADLTMIRRNVALEARIIDDLLDLARIDRGKLALIVENISLHDLIEATLQMYEPAIRDKSLNVRLDMVATNARVTGDPARLQQVLWNIVGNAIKFTLAGGTLEVKTFNPDEASLVAQVTDSGIGMSEATMKHLFSPFYQGEHEKRRTTGGLGLGMAISKALIDQHQGTITVASPGPGQGSTFAIKLAVAKEGAEAPAGEHPEVPAEPMRLRILLVEDHIDTARTLSMLLRRRGHDVEVAGSVAEALRAVRQHQFHVIVSDIGLPDGTGNELIRQVRESSDLPAIALTGHGMCDDVEQCLAAGFDSHITKPVSIQQLVMEITRLAVPAHGSGLALAPD